MPLCGITETLSDVESVRVVHTAPAPILWLMNHTEMPLANLIGHGDVGAYSLSQIRGFCDTCGLKVEKLEAAKKFRMHLVASKGR